MQTWLARLLNQPVAQGAVAEEDGKGRGVEDIRVPGENGKIRVIFMLQCMYVVHIYVAVSM